ncbi:hypothetical protein ACQKFG_05665 [Peribacillus sp. NPDC076916]|uniref:hypothetical protein n=1 Tax=Peribacillus sp. NPDC076916 TaxID=3390608 RepID=UPI003D03783A
MFEPNFNQYKVSGESAPVWSVNTYKLMRAGAGIYSGQMIGELLYSHFVEGNSFAEVKANYPFMPHATLTAILRGRFSPEAYIVFMEMKEKEPEMLRTALTVTTTKIRGEI